MRKITREAVNAFKGGYNFSKGNTKVENRDGETFLYLHGNMIAHKFEVNEFTKVFISTCGWKSNTTKERLNGVLDAFNLPGIYQNNFEWYFTDGTSFEDQNAVFVLNKNGYLRQK